jgi:hypothetical protein
MNIIKKLWHAVRGTNRPPRKGAALFANRVILYRIISKPPANDREKQLNEETVRDIVLQTVDVVALNVVFRYASRYPSAAVISQIIEERFLELASYVVDKKGVAQFKRVKSLLVQALLELNFSDHETQLELVRKNSHHALLAVAYSDNADLMKYLAFDCEEQSKFRRHAQQRLIFMTDDTKLLKRLNESTDLDRNARMIAHKEWLRLLKEKKLKIGK